MSHKIVINVPKIQKHGVDYFVIQIIIERNG